MPSGYFAQTPHFRELSTHYIELTPNAFTPLGQGAVVYHAPEVTLGGETAVDFDRAVRAGNGQPIVKIRLKDVPPGTYEWVRAGVTYQNYDIVFNVRKLPLVGDLNQQTAHTASFVGFNTYTRQVKPKDRMLTVNANRRRGFWVLEVPFSTQLFSGQAPEGAATVVNPLFATSPISPGSCVITGQFDRPLVVTGSEKQSV